MFTHRPAISLLAAGFVFALTLAGAPPSGAAPILPAWIVQGDYDLDVEVGFPNMKGRWAFPLEGDNARLELRYDEKGGLTGAGVLVKDDFGFFDFQLEGSGVLDASSGEYRIMLKDTARNSRFQFDGVAPADGTNVVGTFTVDTGFAGVTEPDSGPMTFVRTDPLVGTTNWRLEVETLQRTRGALRGAATEELNRKGRPLPATGTLTVYGNDDDGEAVLTDGRIRGSVRTRRDGTTQGRLSIIGRGWSVRATGPLDEDGFHATAVIRGAGFHVRTAQILFPVLEGAPPPPPRNVTGGALARFSSGSTAVTLSRPPARFFGRRAEVAVAFPTSDALSTVEANPGTAALGIDSRRFEVTVGGRTYSTANAGAAVEMEIQQFSQTPGQFVTVRCFGFVFDGSGRRKKVDVVVVATAQ